MADNQNTTDNILVSAAKAIGTAAGKVAKAIAVEKPAVVPASAKAPVIAKLQKKDKTRLPRRQKKAQQKLARTSAA